MKFEITASSEEQALQVYDDLAMAMKLYHWTEPIVVYSEIPDSSKPDEATYSVRVGKWDHGITGGEASAEAPPAAGH
jgi:hypothetical protein